MKLAEIHTSDLTASCMKFVELRLKGKVRSAAPSAMFRGMVAGEAMRILHERHLHGNGVDPGMFTPIAVESADSVRSTLDSEGRILTDAVVAAMADVIKDTADLAERYYARFKDRFARCQLLGCEVPVRWKFAPRMPEFASHIDLLFRDETGQLVFLDWKLRETAPTWHYLTRNLQFGCYYASCIEGRMLLSDGLSSDWKMIGERPRGVWLHLWHLLPFGRKTVCEDDRGFEREFARGDERPTRMSWREVEFASDICTVEEIRRQLIERCKMYKADVFPANPDPVACSLCEAESFCPRFDMLY